MQEPGPTIDKFLSKIQNFTLILFKRQGIETGRERQRQSTREMFLQKVPFPHVCRTRLPQQLGCQHHIMEYPVGLCSSISNSASANVHPGRHLMAHVVGPYLPQLRLREFLTPVWPCPALSSVFILQSSACSQFGKRAVHTLSIFIPNACN